jgi:hypothetical protein
MICKERDFRVQVKNKPSMRYMSNMHLISWICPHGSETSTVYKQCPPPVAGSIPAI